MEIILIAAIAANRVIGRDNRIPWHLPEDLQWFKQVTMGSPMIMGRKTHLSIGRPLPGRANIVLSRNKTEFPGCTRAADLDQALALCRELGADKSFIIGGQQLFAEGLAVADTILLGVLEREVTGDVFFPPIPTQFQLIREEEVSGGPEPYRRQLYQRITA